MDLTRLFRARDKNEVSERLKLAEDVLFARASSADVDTVRVVAELTSALCQNETEAAVDGGSFVFFKVRNNEGNFQIFHKRLSATDRRILNKHPTLIEEPYRLLTKLEEIAALDLERAAELRSIDSS